MQGQCCRPTMQDKPNHILIERGDWQAGKINSRGSQMWTWGMSSSISFTCSRSASNKPKKPKRGFRLFGIKAALVYCRNYLGQGLPCQAFTPPPLHLPFQEMLIWRDTALIHAYKFTHMHFETRNKPKRWREKCERDSKYILKEGIK